MLCDTQSLPLQQCSQIVADHIRFDLHQCCASTSVQVVGSEGKTTVAVTGACDQPRVSTEPAQVFARRQKTRPDSAKISRQYILSTGQFEFGPLLAGRDSQGHR